MVLWLLGSLALASLELGDDCRKSVETRDTPLVDSGCQSSARESHHAMNFLENHEIRPLTLQDAPGLTPVGLILGRGSNALEVVVTTSPEKPTIPAVRAAWKARVAGRATPVLLVVLYGNRGAICGPTGDQPTVYLDVDPTKLERICSAGLLEPNRLLAILFLADAIPAVESPTSGLRNEGLFATHELINGVPKRADWDASTRQAAPLLARRDRTLLQSLGYTLDELPGREYILRMGQSRVALALLLEREESPAAGPIFSGSSPVSQALAKADAENLEYLIVTCGLSDTALSSSSGRGNRAARAHGDIHRTKSGPPRRQSGWIPLALVFGYSASKKWLRLSDS